jgi:hypothetical protein
MAADADQDIRTSWGRRQAGQIDKAGADFVWQKAFEGPVTFIGS